VRQELHDEPAPPSLYLRVVSTSVSFAKRETQKLSEGQPRLRILSGVLLWSEGYSLESPLVVALVGYVPYFFSV